MNESTGESKAFNSIYEAMKFTGSKTSAPIVSALDRCGTVKGWKMYDTPEQYRKRIEQIEQWINEVEEISR